VIHRILTLLGSDNPTSLAQVAKTCRCLRAFVYEEPDEVLWKEIHFKLYDDPREAGAFARPRTRFRWRQRVQDRQELIRLFNTWDVDKYDGLKTKIDLISNTLLDLYLDLPASPSPENNPLAREDTLNGAIIEPILRSDMFKHVITHLSTRETTPALRPLNDQPGNPNRRVHREVINPILPRLHALLPPQFEKDIPADRLHRGFLREAVYAASNYTYKNDWSPLTSEGKVNWTLVDAIGSIMMSNARDVLCLGEETWRRAVAPMSYGVEAVRGWGFNHLRRPEGLADEETWDWAGVEGHWFGSYAFLDYADWIALNEPRLIQIRRSMNTLDLSRYAEALGDLMRLDLVIDPSPEDDRHIFGHPLHGSSPARTDDGLEPLTTHLPSSDLLPPIYFHGRSAQQQGALTYPSASTANSVRGVVRLTADDPPQVRWTIMIRYGGEDRWKLECVQMGGRGSSRGMVGIWTDAAKEPHTPNGPVWYWKA
ncbi:hypothetical protein TREMEDRAFT_35450, partial [Tremella mesenterica DSM 1558]|uniref:uncharacterized protein n=1 Tax=Tremella mesenterica (strain ATCC 24925 / CBS 8224 / DSM 1558 / NBRC 9311 / NRRL Y-6157 / RJB 2259-6 / UBC 559-6) TaxID=578456 RepID=UPI00032D57C5